MNAREQAIADIDALFPIDSQYEETNKVGERLLAQAKRECEDWRNLPDAILFRYAELCRQEENRQAREAAKVNKPWCTYPGKITLSSTGSCEQRRAD